MSLLQIKGMIVWVLRIAVVAMIIAADFMFLHIMRVVTKHSQFEIRQQGMFIIAIGQTNLLSIWCSHHYGSAAWLNTFFHQLQFSMEPQLGSEPRFSC